MMLVAFIAIYLYDEFETSPNQLIIFQKSKQTLIGYKSGRDFAVFRNDSIENIFENPPLKSFKSSINVTKYSEKTLPEIFQYKDRNILILDSLGILPKRKNIHVVLLTNSPKINLNRLIDSLKPQQIVADGSNYFSYAKRWEKTCKLKKLPFSYTAKQGAFPIE